MPYPMVAPPTNPYGAQVTFQTEGILPPGAVYLGPNDALELGLRVPSVSATVELTVRLLTPQGDVQPGFYTYTTGPTGGSETTFLIAPVEGYLLSAHISANNLTRGQCWVRMHVRQNLGGSDPTLGHLLIQGYLSSNDHLGFPQSRLENSGAGPGWPHTIAPTPIPAGAVYTVTVPAGVLWTLRSAHCVYAADAVAGARQMLLRARDTTGAVPASFTCNATQAPSTTGYYSWVAGGDTFNSLPFYQSALPTELRLLPGYQLDFNAAFGDVGDQFSQIVLYVDEQVA